MYYKEELINGVLCFRLTPDGEFKPLSSEQLTNTILNLRLEVERLQNRLEGFL